MVLAILDRTACHLLSFAYPPVAVLPPCDDDGECAYEYDHFSSVVMIIIIIIIFIFSRINTRIRHTEYIMLMLMVTFL